MKVNKTCCKLVNFGSCFIVHSLGMGQFLFIDRPTLVCGWVNFPIVWPQTPRTNEVEVTPLVFKLQNFSGTYWCINNKKLRSKKSGKFQKSKLKCIDDF